MDKKTMIKCMEQSGLAYQNECANFDPSLIGYIDSKGGVQCFIRKSGDTLEIAFRGSDSKKDWRTNLTFCKKTIPYDNTSSKIRVHSGFLSVYKCDEVRGRLHKLVSSDISRIRITGHSYGAAMSILCAVDLQYNFPSLDYEVVVFGCPRIGNRAFRESYNKRVFKTVRVENGNDIVTKVPFAIWGYYHVGTRVGVGAPRVPGVVSFEAHRPQRYYSSIIREYLP